MHIKTETAAAVGINFAFFGISSYRMLSLRDPNTRLVGALAVGLVFAITAILFSIVLCAQNEGIFCSKSSENKAWKTSIQRTAKLTIAPSMAIGGIALVSIATFGTLGKIHV